jgi:hypothetical protein
VLSEGPYDLLWRPGGRAACVALVEDWPMVTLSVASGRPSIADPLDLLKGARDATAKVRRPGDLKVIGEATLADGGVESLRAPVRGWALVDVLDLEEAIAWIARLVASVRPTFIYLVRGFTSPASVEASSLIVNAGLPLIVPGLRGAKEISSLWRRGPRVIAGLDKQISEDKKWALEEGLEEPRLMDLVLGLSGLGC